MGASEMRSFRTQGSMQVTLRIFWYNKKTAWKSEEEILWIV